MSGRSWRHSQYPSYHLQHHQEHQHPHPHHYQQQDHRQQYPEDHYNSPRHRHQPPGPLPAPDSGERPPHYYSSSPAPQDPGPTPALRSPAFGRPLSSSPSPASAPAPASTVRQDGALPAKLYECPGVITCFKPRLGCGLLQLELSGAGREKSVLCFFVSQQVCGNMNVQMKKGASFLVNARLVPVEVRDRVQYLAASLWNPHEPVGSSVMEKLADPPLREHIELFKQFSADLVTGQADEESSSGSQSRKRGGSSEVEVEADGQNKRRRVSELEGEVGTVERFLTDKTGVILVMRDSGTVKVLFHADQVWAGGDSGEGYSPFLELHPSTELPFFLRVGSEVRLSARLVTGCKYDHQASLVWSGDQVPPSNYCLSSLELDKKLNFNLSQHKFLETGDTRHRINPLMGTPDFALPARVAEYLSTETGVLKLEQGSRDFVLFHLNQVWTGGEDAVPLAGVINRLLSDCLPVGSPVMVNMRPIPASLGSKLNFQATCVWPFLSDGPQSEKLLPQYLQRYSPIDERVNLVEELDSHHDKLKKVLRLHTTPFSSEFLPIQAVLMGLPNFWQAQIIAGLNDDFGLIKIQPKRGGELAAKVKSLLVMFHIEDVYDVSGLPAIQSSEIKMSSIMDMFVDLTARSICFDCEPESLLDLQQRLVREGKADSVPLLQAVNVCLKPSAEAECVIRNVAKPTPLRNNPGNFSMGTTSFYLNPTLKLRLNKKLANYFIIANMQPPFKTRLKDYLDDEEEIKVLEEVKTLDENNVQRFLYGEFPVDVESCPADVTNNLPKIIERIPVKLRYLHRSKLESDCGIVEIALGGNNSDQSRSFLAFFTLSRYRFFMEKDCFASDLANIMPVNSTENYYANIELGYPASKVPFLVLDIWNENLRRDLGAPSPSSQSVISEQDFIQESATMISLLTDTSIEQVMRSHKREVMTRERNKAPIRRRIEVPESREDSEQHDDQKDNSRDRRRRPDDSRDYKGDDGRARRHSIEEPPRRERKEPREDLCFKQDNYNPTDVKTIHFENAKYFIMRSLNVEDILVSIKHRIWTCKDQINGKLNHAYRENRDKGPVYLLFSVIGSKKFCGVAEMISFVDFKGRSTVWKSNKARWKGNFRVRWIYLKDVPNTSLSHITLENNEDKPITFTKDGHDVPPESGEEALRLIHSFESSSSILDDGEMIQQLFGTTENKNREDHQKKRPRLVRSNQILMRNLVWKEVLHDHYGRVLKIMGNYGLAVSFVMHTNTALDGNREFTPFQVLFDVYDVLVGDVDCGELGKSLDQVMEVGDLVRFNGVRVENISEGKKERDIRHLATSLLVSKTPEDLKKMKYPADMEPIMAVDQIDQEKIENFQKVVEIMKEKKIRKLEQKFLDQTKDGSFATKVLTLPLPPADNRRARQDRDSQPDIRTGPSQAEIEEMKSYEAKIKEKVLQKAMERNKDAETREEEGDSRRQGASKREDRNRRDQNQNEKKDEGKTKEKEAVPEVSTEDVKDLSKLSEELKPKELRKLIMAYVGAISSLPEEPEKRNVKISEVVKKINTEKNIGFFEEFFIALGQNCIKAEKGIKVGHVFVTQMQIRSIRSRGIISRKDISIEKPEEQKFSNKDQAQEKELTQLKLPEKGFEIEEKVVDVGHGSDSDNEIEVLPCIEDSGEDNDAENEISNEHDIVAIDEISQNEPISSDQEGPKVVKTTDGVCNVEINNDSPPLNNRKEDSHEAGKVVDLLPDKIIEDQEVEVEKLTDQNDTEASKASILSDFPSSVLRKFLKHFSKLIEMPSERTMEDVSRECEIPLRDAEDIGREVTKQCKLVIVIDDNIMGSNAFKVQIAVGALIAVLIIHNLYLKLELETLVATAKERPSSISSGITSSKEPTQIVIYNRVPKTGSTSFMNVAYELYKQNSYRVVQLHVSHFKHILTTGDQRQFARNISGWSDYPTLYHGHFAYFDLARLGVSVTPIYINMIRQPLERLVSHYYFLRYGDDVLVNKVRAKEGDTTTFDECVQLQQPDCDPKRMWLQIPFFCGGHPQCWELGSEWALSQAKSNLVNKYLLVGVTEELDSFVEVLEELLPQFFSGAKQFLDESGKSHIKHTRHKDPLSEDTVRKMKKTKVWKLENDFYNFALKKFHSVKAETFEQKKSKSNFFNYEKIRPKM